MNYNFKTMEKRHLLLVDSRHRDIDRYPSPSNYVIQLPKKINNIIKVKLLSATIPDVNIAVEPYLVLDINELNNNKCEIYNTGSLNLFEILRFSADKNSGFFYYISPGSIHDFEPKFSMARLTINIRNADGNLFNFGTDSGTAYPAIQNSFLFEIFTEERDDTEVRSSILY